MKNIITMLFITIGLLLFSCSGNNNKVKDNNSNKNLIPPTEIMSFRLDSNLQVSTNVFESMAWDKAIELTKLIGDNWRLPTKEEFKILFMNQITLQSKIELFSGGYWTSTELDKANAWQSSFGNDYFCEYYSKNHIARVIFVKSE